MKRALPWSDFQITLGPDGEPLRRGAYALDDHDDTPFSPSKNAASMAGTAEAKGGSAAARAWAKASKTVDWSEITERVYGVGQCAECQATPRPHRCVIHRRNLDGSPWVTTADPGLRILSAEAEAREAKARSAPGAEWRGEWRELRAEQLRIQGQGRAATAERLSPGRPESVQWIENGFAAQIGYMCRVEGWEHEQATGCAAALNRHAHLPPVAACRRVCAARAASGVPARIPHSVHPSPPTSASLSTRA